MPALPTRRQPDRTEEATPLHNQDEEEEAEEEETEEGEEEEGDDWKAIFVIIMGSDDDEGRALAVAGKNQIIPAHMSKQRTLLASCILPSWGCWRPVRSVLRRLEHDKSKP